MEKTLPSISVVIPTLNADSVLEECLKRILTQDYPKDKIELVVADGGSTDGTVELAKKYGARVVENKLKTGEAGKAAGFHAARNELIALIDSDNYLPDSNWFKSMVAPFEDPRVVGSEPWEYTWRREDGFIDRYCALMGMNDPLCYFTGNYDRQNILSGHWTAIDLEEEDKGNWVKVTLAGEKIPTIGANGTMLRKEFLEGLRVGDYLFDIDLIAEAVAKRGEVKFAKVKVGIIHAFCGSDLGKFARKQRRRIRDMLARRSVGDIFVKGEQGERAYNWSSGSQVRFTGSITKFVFACVTIIPLLYQAVRGYWKSKDWAMLMHPVMCWTTLGAYSWGTLESFFNRSELSREGWGQ